MKKFLIMVAAIAFICAAVPSFAGVTLRYHNDDSADYKFDVKISGSSTTVAFDHSRTASVTIQGGGSSAQIMTPSGTVTVKDGNTVEIKNGKIEVKN
jgi:hypothetical protein